MTADRREKKKRAAVALLLFLIAISIASLFLSLREPPPPKPDMRPLLEVAKVLAEETSVLLEKQGQVVVITAEGSDPHKAQIEAFQASLKQKGMVPAIVENLKPEQMRQGPGMGGIPADRFLKLLEKYPDAAAVVSFIGPPEFKDDEMSKLPPRIPKIAVFASMGTGVKKLLQKEIIQVAIIPRMGPPPPPPNESGRSSPAAIGATTTNQAKTMSGREMFDMRYEIVTPESDLSKLFEPPAPPSMPPAPTSK